MKRFVLAVSVLVFLPSCNPKRPQWKVPEKNAADDGEKPASKTTIPGKTGTSQAGLNPVWKRYRAFESGLSDGLGLKREETCLELGKHKCIDEIHLAVLGGNEPMHLAQYERSELPSALTAVAVDRIVLRACSNRLELDRVAGDKAEVFKFFPLSGPAPDAAQIQMQAAELYRRILARDPESAELQAIVAFGGKQKAPDKLALSICVAIAASSENIFL